MLTGSDLATWLSIPSPSVEKVEELNRVVEVAYRNIETRIHVRHLNNEAVEQAILMLAARLWNRQNSPTGVVEMDGYATGVRNDRDIDMLLAPYLRIAFA